MFTLKGYDLLLQENMQKWKPLNSIDDIRGNIFYKKKIISSYYEIALYSWKQKVDSRRKDSVLWQSSVKLGRKQMNIFFSVLMGDQLLNQGIYCSVQREFRKSVLLGCSRGRGLELEKQTLACQGLTSPSSIGTQYQSSKQKPDGAALI